jgi:hypothetical protein
VTAAATEEERQEAAISFMSWLEGRVIASARGDDETVLEGMRADRFWLGKLGSESAEWKKKLGQRANRMDPCAVGFRFRPAQRRISVEARFCVWTREDGAGSGRWRKSDRITASFDVDLPSAGSRVSAGAKVCEAALEKAGLDRHRVRCDVEVEREEGGEVATITLVNETPEGRSFDANIYEVELQADVGDIEPFLLEALPDSFRYDRRVPAYGINCGIDCDDGVLKTVDVVTQHRFRPKFWDPSAGPEPDLSFETLAEEPREALGALVGTFAAWHEQHWSQSTLADRASRQGWSDDMLGMAIAESEIVANEVRRCQAGVTALDDPTVLRAFKLMNEAFIHSGQGKYDAWRPFQIGFLLTVLPSLLDPGHEERLMVDTLWFATGGGKTETYLAVIVLACFHDRLHGKGAGISAWGRFPLRMLSLQQTQRFADALAGAELIRQREEIEGDPFAIGFFVGSAGTPNKIRKDGDGNAADSEDLGMPGRNRVLLHCPFCFSQDLEMGFNRREWVLEHRCSSENCPWEAQGLPFHVVDEEIYRFLPSVVIGTLDKAAILGMQAAARGLVGSPVARCTGPSHGYTYATRSKTPTGCLVPDCSFERQVLDQPRELFAMRVHIQDELHLLRDTLGAVDSHYETLLDHLHEEIDGASPPKVIASSATLAGYQQQTRELYSRQGAAFPHPGPAEGLSFWISETPRLMRRFVGIAPRGQTLEFVNERIAEAVQMEIRRLVDDPGGVCSEAGIAPHLADFLVSIYGTQVVYGIRVRDVEAAGRSLQTQSPIEPLNVGMLTGGTLLADVRDTIERLDNPEPDFDDRLHIICASSMMSHGVDIDRFNVITLLGVPLTTSEFIQTSARIGRRWPGLAFVLHRMGVERDSSVFRSFPTYIRHGDRFVAPIAITRRSRRVLRNTFPGLWAARVLNVHEPRSINSGSGPLSTASKLRAYAQAQPIEEEAEFEALCRALGLDPASDDPLTSELRRQVRDTFSELLNPASTAKFIGQIPPRSPMRSLRDVESQIPIWESRRG